MRITFDGDSPYVYGTATVGGRRISRIASDEATKMRDNPLHCAGIRIRFISDSERVGVFFRVANAEKSSVTGVSLYSGIQYRVSERINGRSNTLKQEILTAKNENEESGGEIYCNQRRVKLCYEIYLPSFCEITEIAAELGDGASISAYGYENPGKILFLGGPLTKGIGCSFATAAYTQIVGRKTDVDFCNLSLSKNLFLDETFLKPLKMRPSVVVTELTSAAYSYEAEKANLSRYVKFLLKKFKNVPIIVLSQPYWGDNSGGYAEKRALLEKTLIECDAEYPGRIFHIDGEKIFSAYDFDEYTFSLYNVNDNGNRVIADEIVHAMSFLKA